MKKKIIEQFDQRLDAAGFTMIELLVVITMVGILAAISAPSWISFLTQQRLDRASTSLVGVLRTAQDSAQNRQQDRQVIFSSTDLSVTVRNNSASTGGTTTDLGDGELDAAFNLNASTPIVFDHDGQVSADTLPYVIKISNDNSSSQSCVIITTLLGGVKTSKGNECDTFVNSPF